VSAGKYPSEGKLQEAARVIASTENFDAIALDLLVTAAKWRKDEELAAAFLIAAKGKVGKPAPPKPPTRVMSLEELEAAEAAVRARGMRR
jgi:hypothetical protein